MTVQAPSPVQSISLDAASHPLKAVTVFQSSTAELTREISIRLAAGHNHIKISGISSNLDLDSVRMHGLSTSLRLVDITCKLLEGSRQPPADRATLQAKLKALQEERAIRVQEAKLFDEYATSLRSEHLAPEKLSGFVDEFIQRKRTIAEAIRDIDEQLVIVRRENSIAEGAYKGTASAVVTAVVFAQQDTSSEFKLTYLVSGVGWEPCYDLRATSTDGKPASSVSLQYHARITQSTGEDWANTALTLSTATSQALFNLSIPVLRPLAIRPEIPVMSKSFVNNNNNNNNDNNAKAPTIPHRGGLFGAAGGAQLFGSAQGTPATTFGAFGQASADAPPPPPAIPMPAAPSQPQAMAVRRRVLVTSHEDAEEVEGGGGGPPGATTVVNRSTLAMAYRVEGAVSLPSDGTAHKVAVALLRFDAALTYVCVPRRTPAAYIECKVKNTSEYELLAGPVSVFMNEGFVSKTWLDRIGIHDTFKCVLGMDSALKVAYKRSSRTEREPPRSFAPANKTTTQTVRTTLTNQHAFDVPEVLVRDGIPLGDEDAQCKVLLRKPAGLAEVGDGKDVELELEGAAGGKATVRWSEVVDGRGGEKDGMYEWACGIQAGKEVVLEAEWDVKTLDSIKWQEEEASAARLFGQ